MSGGDATGGGGGSGDVTALPVLVGVGGSGVAAALKTLPLPTAGEVPRYASINWVAGEPGPGDPPSPIIEAPDFGGEFGRGGLRSSSNLQWRGKIQGGNRQKGNTLRGMVYWIVRMAGLQPQQHQP
jgi:hypothetical protein